MLHLLSLALGFLSWGLGLAAVIRRSRVVSFGSFTLCAGALVLQLLELRRLIRLGDWSALMDTINAVIFAAAVLMAVTTALNAIALRPRK